MGSATASRAVDLGGRKLLYLVTEDWFFCLHRLPIARAARAAGAEVVVATRVGRHRDVIEREGFRIIPLPWRRGSKNPLAEARALLRIIRIYREERPDVVHHVAVKAAVYGGIAAALSGRPPQLNGITGLGYTTTSTELRARVLRALINTVFRWVLDREETRVIVENPDDASALVQSRAFGRQRVHVVRGAGVDTQRFRPAEPADGPVTALLAGRMLRSKGVEEAAGAARLLRERGVNVRVALVGEPDPENPQSIPAEELRRWSSEGLVDWRGHRDDMPAQWRGAHIGLLPSYREGLPVSLLEAASCGLPLVATDVPGCREIVIHEDNGLLVPLKSVEPLADALERLGADAGLRARMGRRSRELVEEHFAESIVVEQILSLYGEMVGGAAP